VSNPNRKGGKKNRKWNRNRFGRQDGKPSLYSERHGGLLRAKQMVRERKARLAEKMAAYFAARRELKAQRSLELRWKAAENIYPLR
jgi:hypothetical protein